MVIHVGAYPLYGVTARLVDLGKPLGARSLSEVLSADFVLHVGDLAVKNAWIDPRVSVPFRSDSRQDFNIFFNAKNGFWTEELRLRKVSGVWLKALRVTDSAGTKVRLLCIDKDYPRDFDNPVEWKGIPDPSCGVR